LIIAAAHTEQLDSIKLLPMAQDEPLNDAHKNMYRAYVYGALTELRNFDIVETRNYSLFKSLKYYSRAVAQAFTFTGHEGQR
jgi:hypothetical protein